MAMIIGGQQLNAETEAFILRLETQRNDLLAACEAALEWHANFPHGNAEFEQSTSNEVYLRLQAAIAKARGNYDQP